MIKKLLFVVALLSLALASGCAKGGSGPCVNNCPAVTVNDGSQSVAGLGLSIPMTATVTGTSQTAVNWTITGSACSGSGNPCGTLTSVTTSSVTYNAPSSVPSNASISVVATLQSDSNVSGSQPLTIIPDTSDVAPAQLSVGIGLTQQFTAVAIPDQAPQNFTWSCIAGSACSNFSWNQCTNCANGVASYTPIATEECGNNCVQITATATVDPTGCTVDPKNFPCTVPKTTVVSSRVTGVYAFQFSGYDNSGSPVKAAGTFTADPSGAITSGVENVLTSTGPHTPMAITGGAYVPSSSDPPNSNNAGTLTLVSGVSPSQFQVVLDGAGDIQMIETDGNGTGSGIAGLSSKNQFNTSKQAFAFGFTGVDSLGNRVGYVGLLPTDGVGTITAGLMDINDNGNTSNICGTSPCNLAGTYNYNSTTNIGHMALNTALTTMDFDFFVANGQTKGGNNAQLSIYVISTDPVDATHPPVMGTMTFQDPATYNNAAFAGTSVSALIGLNGTKDSVSLTLGTTDGASGGSGGTGGFTGTFDWNNAGSMVSVPMASPCDPKTVCSFTYTYVATNNNTGRYVFQMLGNPNSSPVVPPLPFVLYATGANSGFLLDQSTQAVITGTMTQQQGPKQNKGTFANSSMTGTFALATNGNTVSTVAPLTMNLLLTSPGSGVFNVSGTENPGDKTVAGTYSVQFPGTGNLGLTAPLAANYIFYGVDGTHFYLIENATKDAGAVSPLLFMEQ